MTKVAGQSRADRQKLQAVASELRRVASTLYDIGLRPEASPVADEQTFAALVLWRQADVIEEMIVPPDRARRGWFARLLGRMAIALKAADA